jgi:DNA-binding HxlR family transcriptional regulator
MSQSENSQPCPVSILVSLLSGPWTLYILWVLGSREYMRFGALHREIQGISTKVLTERLRMLETEGIIYREYKATIPPQVTYGLTNRGQELMGVIEQIDTIAQRWYGQPQADEAKEIDAIMQHTALTNVSLE